MRMNKKSLHQARKRQKRMIDDKFPNTPSLQIPIDISPDKIQNQNRMNVLAENDENYQQTYLDKSA